MESSGTGFRKRKDYINKGFQAKFIVKFVLLFLLSGLISGIILYFFTNSELGLSYYSANIKLKKVWDIILPTVALSTAVTVVLLGIVIIYMSLYASHKLAGPIIRFETIVNDMAEGKLETFTKIRYDDQLKEFGEGMIYMVDNLKSKIISLKGAVKVVDSAVFDFPRPEDKTRGHIEIELNKIEKELEFFKI